MGHNVFYDAAMKIRTTQKMREEIDAYCQEEAVSISHYFRELHKRYQREYKKFKTQEANSGRV